MKVWGIESSDIACIKQERPTFLELLQTLESDLELIRITEFGGVVENINAEQ